MESPKQTNVHEDLDDLFREVEDATDTYEQTKESEQLTAAQKKRRKKKNKKKKEQQEEQDQLEYTAFNVQEDLSDSAAIREAA